MPVTEAACAPFMEGSWMFSHNGVIDGWPDSVAPLAAELPAASLMTLEAPTDSAFLWALLRDRLRAGHPGATALAGVVRDVSALAPRSRLNLLLHDGLHIAATTVSHALSFLQVEGSVTISSEPLDLQDERWQPVPDLCLLEANVGHCSIRPLFAPRPD
jgi:glutamine amidotransferase